MDNVTHALAGLLLAEAATASVARGGDGAPSPGFRRAAAIVGVVAAELPDADLVYAGPVLGMGKLGYLLHHRGHTHTVVAALLGGLLVWGIALALRRARPPVEGRALLAVALAGTLSHILLDWTNNYGVHPFWPLANGWHYGDAVFIVEPWLWVAALPPLILLARGLVGRLLLSVALVSIVAAAWTVALVGRDVAVALTVAAVAWLAVVRRAPAPRRVALGVGAWIAMEALFFAGSHAARARVREAVGPAYRDAVITPAVGNPFCHRALVVELDAEAYGVRTAALAPFPGVRAVSRCAAPEVDEGDGMRPSTRAATRAVRWGGEWRAPRGELATLARGSCDVAAALRFMRVPAWRREPGGALRLYDLRYGRGGFAEIVAAPATTGCPRAVPPWTPPRADVLAAG